MATINYSDGSVFTIGTGLTTDRPGRARSGPPLMGTRGKSQKVVTGTFTFDNAYPAGGEDISDIFNLFAGQAPEGIVFESPLLSAGTGKHAKVDFAAKKIQLLTNAAAPADVGATDQSAAGTVRWIAWGPR
jgi:hypothetical protein